MKNLSLSLKRASLILLIILVASGSEARESIKKHLNTPPPAVQSASCVPAIAYTDLFINNVRAGLLAGGDMWWDLSNARYEVPAGSGKHSMFAGSLWIGGIDAGGNIRVAAMTYRQTGLDYWAGPIDTAAVDITPARCSFYDRFWKVNRQDVVDFIANGTTTADILSWPGNGDALYNEGTYLAPFEDMNGDGIYDPMAGDYPRFNMTGTYPVVPGTTQPIGDGFLHGDQSVWWVINDVGNLHTQTGSNSLGLEIRCQAFAFSSSLTAVNNATFYTYQVINRSSSNYTDMYFGQWADPDLGNATDDFVGCDVVRGLGYCYNGDADDDGPSGYGLNPPSVGIDFLQGPVADMNDAIDNDRDGCVDCTFFDSAGVTMVIPDAVWPERISMTKFVYYENINNFPLGNPASLPDYYRYLSGIWLDNEPISYGGTGRLGSAGNVGVACNFMFPDDTDPDFQLPMYAPWTEASSGNVPGDRRFLMSAGTFTMAPGEVNYVTTAVLWARQANGGQFGSISLLEQYDDQVQAFFDNCFDTTAVGINDSPDMLVAAHVYPNPATDHVIFDIPANGKTHRVEVFNTEGQCVFSKETTQNSLQWNRISLPAGVYVYRVTSFDGKTASGKLLLQ